VSACKIGGYYVPAKSIVLLSQFVVHHDERYYAEPEKFDPDRWLPEAKAGRPKYAYFPFGGGPRLCIGEPFAWMEGILILAVIAQKWKLRLVPGHPIKTQPLITLRPKHGMMMTTEGR
jgi:cytochrome P450